jgi:hypothetical protein
MRMLKADEIAAIEHHVDLAVNGDHSILHADILADCCSLLEHAEQAELEIEHLKAELRIAMRNRK